MPRFIVKNPETGKYQLFSTVVDAFLFEEEVTKEELIQYWQYEHGRSGVERLNFDRIDNGTHTSWTYEDCKMWHDHTTYHNNGQRFPDTCDICSDIEKDEKEYESKTR
jgi:hypothetical protein